MTKKMQEAQAGQEAGFMYFESELSAARRSELLDYSDWAPSDERREVKRAMVKAEGELRLSCYLIEKKLKRSDAFKEGFLRGFRNAFYEAFNAQPEVQRMERLEYVLWEIARWEADSAKTLAIFNERVQKHGFGNTISRMAEDLIALGARDEVIFAVRAMEVHAKQEGKDLLALLVHASRSKAMQSALYPERSSSACDRARSQYLLSAWAEIFERCEGRR